MLITTMKMLQNRTSRVGLLTVAARYGVTTFLVPYRAIFFGKKWLCLKVLIQLSWVSKRVIRKDEAHRRIMPMLDAPGN